MAKIIHLAQTTITPPFHQTYGSIVCGFALEFGMLEQAQKAWLLDTSFLRYDDWSKQGKERSHSVLDTESKGLH